MKLAALVGERFKERPSECLIDSHALMVRGGYIKYVANGIYSVLPPLKRVQRKIEQIIREEMDGIDGQEVLLPAALPASLWQASGRYESVGSELLRFCDRSGSPMVLGMTHEEAAVSLVREYGQSYTKYPFMIYQFQTKFRDEARPRGGLIRVREFTMKDGYSFHTSQQDLEQFYERCRQAYERIFARVGIPETVCILSDAGMMGGNISHEFMLLTPVGEDSVVLCRHCAYRANLEAAENRTENRREAPSEPLQPVHTPGIKSIEELCRFLQLPPEKTCKAVVYQKESGGLVAVFLRGDCEVSEAKLRCLLGCGIIPASFEKESGLTAGFIGPYRLKSDCERIFDRSLENACGLVCGGNRPDTHYTGLDIARELGDIRFADVSKAQEGGICPACGQRSLTIRRGIEVGNIFQLGDRYSRALDMHYQDENGESRYPVMGCYGIGIGRLAAAICEAHHDAFGPIWPLAVAPWQVHLCAVRADEPQVKAAADRLYGQLQQRGMEVLYDDRPLRAGILFSDADLIGCPVRITVSPRSLQQKAVEISTRDRSMQKTVEEEALWPVLQKLLQG
jgi:prolyl-tRNA synthetase